MGRRIFKNVYNGEILDNWRHISYQPIVKLKMNPFTNAIDTEIIGFSHKKYFPRPETLRQEVVQKNHAVRQFIQAGDNMVIAVAIIYMIVPISVLLGWKLVKEKEILVSFGILFLCNITHFFYPGTSDTICILAITLFITIIGLILTIWRHYEQPNNIFYVCVILFLIMLFINIIFLIDSIEALKKGIYL